ncbi:zinc finger protein, putative [Ricinus communis]|uniref:RING-type E3 ubiquitin transferase n=2 Tax=Ricinus communis TaxID=3988 RepID=B9R971_RICCO|nr:zinc finger protein, putative [Ricinus communis]|eukprot:XP_002511546.1 E3 ubiquitin-protein ligase hrd-1 [Ricinus communis]
MSINTTYQCEAWLIHEEDEQINHSLPCEAIFLIKMYCQIIPCDSTVEQGTNTSTIFKEFHVQRDYLLHNTTSWSTLSSMLADMNIPMYAYPMLMVKIKECAQNCRDMERKVIPMVVKLRIIHAVSDIATVSDEAFSESFSSQRLTFVGASKSAIDALETVIIQNFSNQCVICLEDIQIGIEATCLPCKHIYHGGCISNWLKNSNCCPLCRFQIPS